jgi:hypothetical protein
MKFKAGEGKRNYTHNQEKDPGKHRELAEGKEQRKRD